MTVKQTENKRNAKGQFDGEPGPGRATGSKNKVSGDLRDMVLSAAGSLHKDGIEAAFKEWLDKNPKNVTILWSKIIPQLLPKTVEASIEDKDKHEARLAAAALRMKNGFGEDD